MTWSELAAALLPLGFKPSWASEGTTLVRYGVEPRDRLEVLPHLAGAMVLAGYLTPWTVAYGPCDAVVEWLRNGGAKNEHT